ncbi:uncharacterized protein BYT42DRAFT_253353 [Radiomyces spectabilis]|uniref:uncharacterized protein n=1 Tax=Radiomyces spectabilis TaxID=64574 RepID=UPI002220E334|nr:uncharacterized protein BYT42DRAFT_253353 [Radiomyces spectabilis]KAI8384229.1 hypothetical protein BYT42DRAFT_253353 [Radiomyces spectabilis]
MLIQKSYTDSESEPEGEPELEWHRKIENGALIREKAKANAWPIKTGKWNAEELLRLEKRIKKLARRRNMTLESFREEILTQPFRNKKQFWWDVAKKFPDRALYHIVRHGKQAYDRQNYQGQWTPEEDKQLLELVKTYGRKFATTIKDQMNRTASACEARYRTIKHQEVGKTGKWTNEESEKLKKTITEYKTLHGTPPSWEYVSSKGFQNERNPRQCKARWQYIQNQENNAGQVTGRGAVTIEDQIRLLERIQKGGWQKEYEIPFGKLQDENFTLSSKRCKSEYIKLRKHIPGFEKMKVQGKECKESVMIKYCRQTMILIQISIVIDIVSELLRTRCIMLESLKE